MTAFFFAGFRAGFFLPAAALFPFFAAAALRLAPFLAAALRRTFFFSAFFFAAFFAVFFFAAFFFAFAMGTSVMSAQYARPLAEFSRLPARRQQRAPPHHQNQKPAAA
ncbi:MAG: hypothetical protein KIT18_05390 [Burkholderiales bacterium]|nr:hypothetical protein [Burkholderiales bacterium]